MASSSQMSTDRWLFPGPRTSREVFHVYFDDTNHSADSLVFFFFCFRRKNVMLLHSEQEQITRLVGRASALLPFKQVVLILVY